MTLERLEEVLTRLHLAADHARHPDFRALWLLKAEEVRRTELAKAKLTQHERNHVNKRAE
jgi:hypothetical protein